MNAFIKTHQNVHLRSVHFTAYTFNCDKKHNQKAEQNKKSKYLCEKS